MFFKGIFWFHPCIKYSYVAAPVPRLYYLFLLWTDKSEDNKESKFFRSIDILCKEIYDVIESEKCGSDATTGKIQCSLTKDFRIEFGNEPFKTPYKY